MLQHFLFVFFFILVRKLFDELHDKKKYAGVCSFFSLNLKLPLLKIIATNDAVIPEIPANLAKFIEINRLQPNAPLPSEELTLLGNCSSNASESYSTDQGDVKIEFGAALRTMGE